MYLVKSLIFGASLVAFTLISLTSGSNLVKRDVDGQKKVVCYYANWAVYRQGLAKFSPQNINPYLCTHLIYAFGGLQKDDTIAPFDKYQDLEKSGYSRFAALKTYNKDLKTMLAIGGWNEASKKFSPMVADPQRRYTFIKSAIRFLRQYNFDGIDLDWEYPTQRKGGRPQDRENYAKLIEEMRESFDREADQTGKDPLIISMAVPASLEITAEGYDVRSLDKNLDFFNILAYDYHSSFEPAVNHHSPLFRTKEISEFDFRANLNIESTIKFYIGHGASPHKLVLGIPTYGRSYTLVNPDAHQIGSPADGPGKQGNGTKEDGYLAYYEICNGIKDLNWEVVNENRGSVGPYAHGDNFWVGYDDIDIVKEKAYYVAEEGLGGIMFWTIDNDDFRGTCHNEPYPLIEAAKRALYSSTTSVQSSGSDKPRSLNSNYKVTTPEPPTTPSSEPGFVCTDEGFFPHTKSCKKYYWCLEAAGIGMVAHTFTCPQGLFFNSLTDGCDFKRNVNCGDKSQNEEVEVESTTTESNRPSNPNDKSVQDILEEIKLAGGLEAFEEQLQEQEEEKKELKQRTKSRSDDISKKTRNRFSKVLERKKPKISESSSEDESSESEETNRPGSLLSRLATRRRNNSKSSGSTSPSSSDEKTLTTTPTIPSSSSSSNPPSRTGFSRNRSRPSFLRNKPISSPILEESDEENEVTPLETPRNSQARNRLRNVQRTSFLNRGAPPKVNDESELGDSEPVQISSDSFRTKSKTVRRNFGRISEEESQGSEDQEPSLITTEGATSLPRRSQNTESRKLPYVTIDRSRGRTKLSGEGISDSPAQEEGLTSSPQEEKIISRDPENTVRDLEYVTIQRGVPSREKLLSKVTSSTTSTVPSLVTTTETIPGSDAPVVMQTTQSNDSQNLEGEIEESSTIDDSSQSLSSFVTESPEIITTTTKSIFDEENILNITVFKTISETLRLPHKIFNPQSSRVITGRVRTTTSSFLKDKENISTTTELNDLIVSTIEATEATTIAATTTIAVTSTSIPSTTTTVNKIQELINQRKQSGKNKFFLNKSRKELEAINEINDSRSTSPSPEQSIKIPSFRRPAGLRAKFPRKLFDRAEVLTTTTTEASTSTLEPTSSSTERSNGFVKPSRPTNRLFNKFVSRGTIGKLFKEEKSTTTEVPDLSVSVTRSTIISFIPTRPFALRPSNGFKPIDLSAAPSKKSISQERSSLLANSFFAKPSVGTTTEAPTTLAPEVERTTDKLTVGKILANLHGDSTEKPESSTLRPKSFKPKFQRNKLREKLRHQLEEEKETGTFTSEEVESSTEAVEVSLGGDRFKDKITTPRRKLSRPFPQISKSPRTLSTESPIHPSTSSRFQPTPRRSLRNRFSPTSIGFSRNKPKTSPSFLPSLLSTTTASSLNVGSEQTGKVLSNEDIAEKLGLIPTPIPLVAIEDESQNIIESSTASGNRENEIFAGLLNSDNEFRKAVPTTERSSIESLLKSAVVSSPTPKTDVRPTASKRVPFFPQPLPPLASSEETEGVDIEENFVGPFSRPSSSFTSRRQNTQKRGRKVKRRRGPNPTLAPSESPETLSPTRPVSLPPKRQFSRVPINFARKRNPTNIVRATSTISPPPSEQSDIEEEIFLEGTKEEEEAEEVNEDVLNEVEPKFRRRRPDFSRRRNLGKLSIKGITSDKSHDSDFDSDIIVSSKEESSTEKTDSIIKEESVSLINKEESIQLNKTTESEEDFESTTLATNIIISSTVKTSNLNYNVLTTTSNPVDSTTQRQQKPKTFLRRQRNPLKFSGLRRQSEKHFDASHEDSNQSLENVVNNNASENLEYIRLSGTNSTLIETTTHFSEEPNDDDDDDSRIARRSTLSSISKEVDFTTEGYISTITDFGITSAADDNEIPSSTTAQPSTSTSKKTLFSVRNRPNYLKSQVSPLEKQSSSFKSSEKALEKSDERGTSLFARTTTPSSSLSEAPRSQGSSPSRSLFKRPLNRPKLPFFQRKDSPQNTKETTESLLNVAELIVTTTEPSSFSSSSSILVKESEETTSQITLTSASSQFPSTTLRTTSVSQKDTTPQLFRSSKSRPPFFKFSQRRNPKVSLSSKVDDTILDNSIDADELAVKSVEEEEEEANSKPQDEEESVGDDESLEERLRLRLQQRKIKNSQSRNSLFKNSPRRSSFIRPRQQLTSTTEASIFVPTASSTIYFEEDIANDEELNADLVSNEEKLITSPVITATTETILNSPDSQIVSTTRPLLRFRPRGPSLSPSLASPSSVSPRRNPFRPNRLSPSNLPLPVEPSDQTLVPQFETSTQSSSDPSVQLTDQTSELPIISSSPADPIQFQPSTPEPDSSPTTNPITPFALQTPKPQIKLSPRPNRFRPSRPTPSEPELPDSPNPILSEIQSSEPQIQTSPIPSRVRPSFQTFGPQTQSSPRPNRFRPAFQTPSPQKEFSPRPNRVRPSFRNPQLSPQPSPSSVSPHPSSETLPPFSPTSIHPIISLDELEDVTSIPNENIIQDQFSEPNSQSTPATTPLSSSKDGPPLRSRFQAQPRRLNAFRNRFQVSPSSPRPIISKSGEENLFSQILRQQNNLPFSSDKNSNPRVIESSDAAETSTPEVFTSTTTTTTKTTPKPTTFDTTPTIRFTSSPRSVPSRSSVPRQRNPSSGRLRSRPRASTTTTTPFPVYDYYDDDRYTDENNGIGKLKSIDPIYEYELTPLTNKVSITSEGIKCHDVGVFPHPGSCKKFVTCSRRTSRGSIVGWEYECPVFLAFDPVGGRCNWAAEVDCS